MHCRKALGIAILASVATLAAQGLPRVVTGEPPTAGKLADGKLRVRLVLTQGRWFPEAEDGPSTVIQTITEEGKPPHDPAPTLRVREGVPIEVTIRNALDKKAKIFGLYERPKKFADEHFDLAAGETKTVTFVPGPVGVYLYAADTGKGDLVSRNDTDIEMNGVIIVDPKVGRIRADHTFVISNWYQPGPDPKKEDEGSHELWALNGKMWPYTERLTVKTGATQRFLIANATIDSHPMHLHGNYFTVASENEDGDHAMPIADDHRFAEVTHAVPSFGTTVIDFALQRPGRWLFHCHMLYHTQPELGINDDWKKDDHRHMSGLVVGMEAVGAATSPKAKPRSVRHLVLDIEPRDQKYADGLTGIHASIRESGTALTSQNERIGPVLDITRGQPVEIEVRNRLKESTTIHWHGIELESFYDGVSGYGGTGATVTPLIEPGQSFTARFTPPRAGTFIYHSHFRDVNQVGTGLYGALIVRESGEKPADNDLIFLLAGDGPKDGAPFLLNGEEKPGEIKMVQGKQYRLRFISMRTAKGRTMRILRDGQLVQWKRWAKDGADLPAVLRTSVDAEQMLLPGETYDYLFTPETSGTLSLETGRKDPEIKVPIHIVPAP
jgi:FtsP/CotA-like multicopper oxidase with cupredoxin domain